MPIVTPTPVPSLIGGLPDPTDRTTYGARGRAMWQWETSVIVPGLHTLADQTMTNAQHAELMAASAQAMTNFLGAWADLPATPISPPAAVSHDGNFYILLAGLADPTASEPGVSEDWGLFQFDSAVDVTFDPAATGLPATNVQQAIDEVVERLASGLSFNLLDNPRFAINQKSVTGTVVRAAGVTGHDRWKAGADGCTYTFASAGGVTTLTIISGSLMSVIEGESLGAGNYTLSWGGTAQGRVGAGSYSASPITAAVAGGADLSVEFSTGTLSLPQFERGNVAHLFSGRTYGADLALCQRFCNYKNVRWRLDEAWNTGVGIYYTDHYPAMRAVPTPTITINASTNFSTPMVHSNKLSCTTWLITTSAPGPTARELDFAVRYEAHL